MEGNKNGGLFRERKAAENPPSGNPKESLCEGRRIKRTNCQVSKRNESEMLRNKGIAGKGLYSKRNVMKKEKRKTRQKKETQGSGNRCF